MGAFHAVAPADEVGDGKMAKFGLAGATVAVANLSGTFFAFDDVCTHRGCSLSKGHLEGVSVVCPCHGGRYDLVTGAVLAGPPPLPEPRVSGAGRGGAARDRCLTGHRPSVAGDGRNRAPSPAVSITSSSG